MIGRVVGTLVLLAPAAFAQATAPSAAVAGRVVGTANEPVPSAEVLLVRGTEVIRSARTDSAGRFLFAAVEPRPATLRVRRVGYSPRTVNARVEADAERHPQEIVLDPMPAELREVVVLGQGSDPNPKLAEFYEHRARGRFGSFFTPADIEQKRPRYVSELMRFVPGTRLYTARLGSFVRMRGGCRPLLWVDGVRLTGAELDDTVNMNDVAAVEVYASFAGIPAQYMDRSTNCGAIVVWLKS